MPSPNINGKLLDLVKWHKRVILTDEQAEVLIKDRVPKEKIIGVAFPKETYDVEKLRLSFCKTFPAWKACSTVNNPWEVWTSILNALAFIV